MTGYYPNNIYYYVLIEHTNKDYKYTQNSTLIHWSKIHFHSKKLVVIAGIARFWILNRELDFFYKQECTGKRQHSAGFILSNRTFYLNNSTTTV